MHREPKEQPYFAAMSKQEKGGMRSAFHYIVEFAVILLGISVSVMIEKNNAREYKRDIKDQGLTRILANLAQDSLDMEYNLGAHLTAKESCQWVLEHRYDLSEQHPDTIGKHCAICVQVQTIFVDNQEEYRTLQHSGLLEFVENDIMARSLQSKYAQHDFIKKIETYLIDFAAKQHPDMFRCLSSYPGVPFYKKAPLRRWNGKELGAPFFERTLELITMHDMYVQMMQERLTADAQLKNYIRTELGADE